MSVMRVVFMGSAPLSCRALESLFAADVTRSEDGPSLPVQVVGVVTQPDRPKGRSLTVASSPVKMLAERKGVPVLSPENVNAAESLVAIRALRPDIAVVVAFGQMLSENLLNLPPRKCVNVHASLLPRYRGAAPIQWAIANGDIVTGVTTMYMVRKMDAGDIIMQREVRIPADDTAGVLHDRLASEGATLLMETLEAISQGTVVSRAQDETAVTLAPKLYKEDGRIRWAMPAAAIHNRIRAFNPWPGSFCLLPVGSKRAPETEVSRLKILRTRVESVQAETGRVIEVSGEGPLIGTGRDALRILEVQPEGKKIMSGDSYLCGHALNLNDFLL